MASAIDTLARQAQRRLLLPYLARELGWRVMLVLLTMLVSRLFAPLWMFPWVAGLAVAADWFMRWRPPSELAAAIELDRQLALKELISTGLLAREEPGLAAAARRQAEDTARSIDPRRLEPGSFGVRYWISALLLAGLLAALPAGGAKDGARPDEMASGQSMETPGREQEPTAAPALQVRSLGERSRSVGSAESDFASAAGMPDASASPGPMAGQRSRSESDSRGVGSGLATGGTEPASPALEVQASSAGAEAADRSAGSGAGPRAESAGTAEGQGTLTAAPRSAASPAPSGTEVAAPGEHTAPDLRAVPPRYRELVKAYYAR